MSAIDKIVAFDGASTPKEHTFDGDGIYREKGVITASYKESVLGIPDSAQGRVTIKKARLGSGVNRVSVRVEIPVMEAPSGVNSSGYTAAPKVAYINTCEVTGFFHDRADIAGRRAVRQLALNIAGDIATSVAAANTGAVPDAFDFLIMPT